MMVNAYMDLIPRPPVGNQKSITLYEKNEIAAIRSWLKTNPVSYTHLTLPTTPYV